MLFRSYGFLSIWVEERPLFDTFGLVSIVPNPAKGLLLVLFTSFLRVVSFLVGVTTLEVGVALLVLMLSIKFLKFY